MKEEALIRNAGLTEGETKVYLALLKLGSSTTGPIIEKSGVANSIIYRILEGLITKGLVSHVTKDKTKHYQAAQPQRILDYIEERKAQLDISKENIARLIPQLLAINSNEPESSVRIFEGFKGFMTAWELMYEKLGPGEEYHSWGVYPIQEERFHLYWKRDHHRRIEKKIRGKILFNQGTDQQTLKNRNDYSGLDARYMPTAVKTPSWFTHFKDTVLIGLQQKDKPMMIVIQNQLVADTFEAYFQDFWKKTKKYK